MYQNTVDIQLGMTVQHFPFHLDGTTTPQAIPRLVGRSVDSSEMSLDHSVSDLEESQSCSTRGSMRMLVWLDSIVYLSIDPPIPTMRNTVWMWWTAGDIADMYTIDPAWAMYLPMA